MKTFIIILILCVFLAFDFGCWAGLEYLISVCSNTTSHNLLNGWDKNFWCEIKITDVAISLFTLFLVLVGLLQAYWLYATVTESNVQHVVTNRAFVFIRSFYYMPTGSGDAVEFWRITPVFENTGNTPTRHMCGYNSAALIGGSLPLNFDFPDTPYPPSTERPTLNVNLIGPRAQLNGAPYIIPIADVLAVSRREKRFYIWGWYDYNDDFKGTKRHRMEFCYELCVLLDPTNPKNMSALGMALHPQYNGHDDQCYRTPKPYEVTVREFTSS